VNLKVIYRKSDDEQVTIRGGCFSNISGVIRPQFRYKRNGKAYRRDIGVRVCANIKDVYGIRKLSYSCVYR
jgi:formylglycine-generating enzyme required for sulfatase activity